MEYLCLFFLPSFSNRILNAHCVLGTEAMTAKTHLSGCWIEQDAASMWCVNGARSRVNMIWSGIWEVLRRRDFWAEIWRTWRGLGGNRVLALLPELMGRRCAKLEQLRWHLPSPGGLVVKEMEREGALLTGMLISACLFKTQLGPLLQWRPYISCGWCLNQLYLLLFFLIFYFIF